MNTLECALTVALVALMTAATRFAPFLLFPGGKKVPPFVDFLGKHLSAAVMAMLVVYCLKDLSFASADGFVPALTACAAVALLHRLKHSLVLSVAGGTALYMLLLRLLA